MLVGDTSEQYIVERVYTNLLHAIDKAIDEGDLERAQAMVRRGATGHPKVMPRLVPDSSSERP